MKAQRAWGETKAWCLTLTGHYQPIPAWIKPRSLYTCARQAGMTISIKNHQARRTDLPKWCSSTNT